MSPSPSTASLARTQKRSLVGASQPALPIYAIKDCGIGTYLATAGNGGEPGVATGFGIGGVFYYGGPTVSTQMLGGRFVLGGSTGYQAYITPTGQLTFGAGQGAGDAYVYAPPFQLNANDVGRLHSWLAYHDGTKLRLWVDRMQAGDGAAITGYAPAASAAQNIGYWPGSVTRFGVVAEYTFRGVPSNAQIAAIFDDMRSRRDAPVALDGATLTHRWSLPKALASVSPITAGQVVPTPVADSVTAATIDDMSRVGSPTVQVIDAALNGLKTLGVQAFTSVDKLATVANLGIRGNPSGFVVRMGVTFKSLSGFEYLASCANSSGYQGWSFLRDGVNLYAYAANTSSLVQSTRVLNEGDLGTPHTVDLVFSGSTVTLVFDGVASAVSATGTYAVPTAAIAMHVGSLNGNYASVNQNIHFIAGGDGGSLAAVQAAAATWLKSRALAPMGLANEHLYNFELDCASGTVPTTLSDRIGTDHVTKTGSLVVSRHTMRTWAHETTPQQIGARGWSAANYASGPMTGFAHTSAPWWMVTALIVNAKGGPPLNFLTKTNPAGTQGLFLWGNSLNSIFAAIGSGANFGTYTVADSDVGRPLILGYQWTGTVLQTFAKRAKLGGDVNAPTYTPSTANLCLGRIADSASAPGTDGVTIGGVMGGLGNLTLAEYQSAYDGYFAEDDLVAVPGKTARLYSLKKTVIANGGSLAAIVDQMGSGESLPIFGAPSVGNYYAHAA